MEAHNLTFKAFPCGCKEINEFAGVAAPNCIHEGDDLCDQVHDSR